jgi:hypothetical protein
MVRALRRKRLLLAQSGQSANHRFWRITDICRDELGLSAARAANPLQAAFTSGVTFSIALGAKAGAAKDIAPKTAN